MFTYWGCKNTSFFFRGKIRPLLGSFSVKFHQRLILSFLVTIFLVTKRSKYLKYIFAIPSLRFRSDALKQRWIHVKKAGCIQLFQIIILKWKLLWKNSLLISSHYGQRPQTSVPYRQQLYLRPVCIFMNIIDMARVTNKLPTFQETL